MADYQHSKTTVKLHIGALRKLWRGPEVTAEVARRAQRAAATSPEVLTAVVKPHRYTARAFVQTQDTDEARRREAEEKHLTRSMDALR